MNRNKWFSVNYIALTSVLTLVAVTMLRIFAPAQFPPLLFLVPLFSLLVHIMFVLLRRRCERKHKDRSFIFMAYRVCRMLLSAVFILVYCVAVREYLLPFAITFAVFYLVLMAFETVHFMKEEKKS